MSAGDKAIILAQVESQSRGKRQMLAELWGYPGAPITGGARGNLTRETEEGRGTGSPLMKTAEYWR